MRRTHFHNFGPEIREEERKGKGKKIDFTGTAKYYTRDEVKAWQVFRKIGARKMGIGGIQWIRSERARATKRRKYVFQEGERT